MLQLSQNLDLHKWAILQPTVSFHSYHTLPHLTSLMPHATHLVLHHLTHQKTRATSSCWHVLSDKQRISSKPHTSSHLTHATCHTSSLAPPHSSADQWPQAVATLQLLLACLFYMLHTLSMPHDSSYHIHATCHISGLVSSSLHTPPCHAIHCLLIFIIVIYE